MKREFGRWAKTECDECGQEFLVTRTYSRVIEGRVVCGDCEMYERGRKDGYEEGYTEGHTEGYAQGLNEYYGS